mmetsp:Transcript_21905/g.51934  ORF Transcript_21905/g.51934 Transcript_21905/m.51934 type:complete len:309 (-) Transcript_21905:102-1028(-)
MVLSKLKSNSSNEMEVKLEQPNDVAKAKVDPTPKNSPTVVNETNYPIVVFLERGTLYNRCVLRPGEAVSMTRRETGGGRLRLSYKVHAMIGDERALPTQTDSIKNVLKVSAVPAAFVAGCLLTAASGGMLSGPSAALAPLVSGIVVKGVVVDAAAIAAGTLVADQAKKIATTLQEDHMETLMGVSAQLKPGERYLSVTGGMLEGPITIEEVSRRKFRKKTIKTMKTPLSTAEMTDILALSSDDGENVTGSTSDSLGKVGNKINVVSSTGKENIENRTFGEKQTQKSKTKDLLLQSFRLQRKLSTLVAK